MNYVNCNKKDLEKEYAALVAEYEEVKGKGLKLNMAKLSLLVPSTAGSALKPGV